METRWLTMTKELREGLDVWFRREVNGLTKDLEKVIDDLVEEGQEFVYEAIETRGTANPAYGGKTAWAKTYYKRGGGGSGKNHPTKGRVWDGDMRQAVEYEVEAKDNAYIGSFGWINNVEDYYLFQEGGFDHAFTGEHIEGMFAMADAAAWAEAEFERRTNKVLRGN